MGCHLGNFGSRKANTASGGRLQAADGFQQRALASTVGADESENLTLVDPKVNTIDSRKSAEVFFNSVGLK